MDCSKIEELLVDYVGNDLSSVDMKKVDEHVSGCEDCARALEETKMLVGKLEDVQMKEPNESVRAGFYKMLSEEKQLQPKVLPIQNNIKSSWKTAFQIAASLLILVSGFGIGKYTGTQETNTEISTLKAESKLLKQDMMMALMENRSPSKRIQAVNYTEEVQMPDSDILNALIERMQYDANVNVRLAAAEALSRFSENKTVKDAFIEALTIDKDPNIQIAIIQFLVKVQDKRALVPMQQLLEQTETPNYVKEQLNQGLQQLI